MTRPRCGTRPGNSVAVAKAKLSHFMENSGEQHWNAGIKVVRFLLKTKDVGIVYDGSLVTQLEAYSDTDWAGNRDDGRSVRGMMLMMCGAHVVWRSTFQKPLRYVPPRPSAMALAKNVGYQARTKHIDIRYHFIREKVASNEVEPVYVDSKNQLAGTTWLKV
ncbi:unnamed protein product [Phytophthora fragariaefolia]|uniref:Unnamed protein product n=1 Tax=Phytophthora fragariaefolia TaxID=1490495 RepID=A0A9W6Y2C8_9STRA|nr:unnamed protein product [Phytophthora fragariaefolia]